MLLICIVAFRASLDIGMLTAAALAFALAKQASNIYQEETVAEKLDSKGDELSADNNERNNH